MSVELFATLGAGMVGALIGSFLNVCILRWPAEQSVVSPRSRCPGCGELIAWYDNIPVFSWLVLLRGRCRRCQAPISIQYPLVELANALTRAGATAAVSGQASAALKITAENWQTAPLSVDQFAQVREYVTRYKVSFALQSADGKPLIEPQDIELAREYTYDQNASAGSPAEQELIQRELRRDMEAAILRRLDVALRRQP